MYTLSHNVGTQIPGNVQFSFVQNVVLKIYIQTQMYSVLYFEPKGLLFLTWACFGKI